MKLKQQLRDLERSLEGSPLRAGAYFAPLAAILILLTVGVKVLDTLGCIPPEPPPEDMWDS